MQAVILVLGLEAPVQTSDVKFKQKNGIKINSVCYFNQEFGVCFTRRKVNRMGWIYHQQGMLQCYI